MKKIVTILTLLIALTLVTVMTIPIIESQTHHTLTLNNQVQKDFNWLDTNNKSTINLTIFQDNISKATSWNSMQLTAITANNLLINNDDKITNAKSNAAANFLVNILKLKPTISQGKNKSFNRSDAKKIKMQVQTYSPLISKNANHTDYVISGGTITIYFIKNGKRLSSNYLLNIAANLNNGIVAAKLPLATNITSNDFNDIPQFKVGQPKAKILVNDDLTNYVKTPIYSLGEKIADLMKQGDHFKIKVSENKIIGNNFVKGDTIKVKFLIGEVQFPTEYTLTII